MAGSVLDTSVLIGFGTNPNPLAERAMAAGDAVLPPLVVAELKTGASTPNERVEVGILLQEVQMYETSLDHWINVGLLRQHLARKGLNVTFPDAHIAQCAIARAATLISRDAIFVKIAQHAPLRLAAA